MKTKNFKLIQAIFEKGLTNVELVKKADFSSEARLLRIINYYVVPTAAEIRALSKALGRKPKDLGFDDGGSL